MGADMDLYLLFARPVIKLYDFRYFGLVFHKYVLHVAQLAAPVNTLLVLYGIKVRYVGPYGWWRF